MKKLFLIIVLAFNLHALNNQENLKIFKNFLNQLGDTFGYKVEYKNAKCVDAHEIDDGSSECTATNFTLTDKNGNIFLEDGYVDSSVDSKYFIETIIRDFKKPIYGRFNDIHIILNLISGEFFIHLDSWRISFKVSHKTTEAYHNKNGKTIPIYGDKNIKYLYVLSGKISLSLSPYYLEKLDIDELYEKILSNFGKASLYREDRIVLKNDLKEFKELKRNKFTIAFEYFPGGSLYKIIQDFKNGEAFGRGLKYFGVEKNLAVDEDGWVKSIEYRENFMLNESIKRFKELGIDLVYDERTCIEICKLKNVRLIKDGEILASAREVHNLDSYEFIIYDLNFEPKFINSLKLKSKTKKLLSETIKMMKFKISNKDYDWPKNLCKMNINFWINEKVSLDYYLNLIHKGSMQDCITDFINKQGDFKLEIELLEYDKSTRENLLDFLKNYPIINDKKVYEEALKNVFKPY